MLHEHKSIHSYLKLIRDYIHIPNVKMRYKKELVWHIKCGLLLTELSIIKLPED